MGIFRSVVFEILVLNTNLITERSERKMNTGCGSLLEYLYKKFNNVWDNIELSYFKLV